jgi:hypothetical protein
LEWSGNSSVTDPEDDILRNVFPEDDELWPGTENEDFTSSNTPSNLVSVILEEQTEQHQQRRQSSISSVARNGFMNDGLNASSTSAFNPNRFHSNSMIANGMNINTATTSFPRLNFGNLNVTNGASSEAAYPLSLLTSTPLAFLSSTSSSCDLHLTTANTTAAFNNSNGNHCSCNCSISSSMVDHNAAVVGSSTGSLSPELSLQSSAVSRESSHIQLKDIMYAIKEDNFSIKDLCAIINAAIAQIQNK